MARHGVRRARSARVGLDGALGRTLSSPVDAREDVPPFARSRVDGYAVVSSDVAAASKDGPVRLRVMGEVVMGALAPGPIGSGMAMRISTGGALPGGATGAVMVEDTEESDGRVAVYDGAEAIENVTLAGADLRAGSRLFDAGTVLTPAKLGLLAGAGVAEVDAFVPPRVALIMTGDELAGPDRPLAPGEIRDINRYSLSAALHAAGFEAVQYPYARDERAAVSAALAKALEECDAVVISGGSSAGERDYTPDVIAEAGAPGVVVHHLRAKPGRPTLLGAVGDRPIVGLPGNPVSAFVMLHVVGMPILLRMLGRAPDRLTVRAVLARSIDESPQLEHRIPVRFVRDGDALVAHPLTGTSAQMHILGFADALVTVPLGIGRLEAGTTIEATPLDIGGFAT